MKPRTRAEKDEPARCPFCKEFVSHPEPIKTATGECIGGRCGCGAVFVVDETGHNVGEAYLDALTLLFGEALNLLSGEPYREEVFSYNRRTHTLETVRDIRRLDTSGKIIFLCRDK